LRGSPLLGDKTYNSKKFIELVLSAGLKAYIRLRERFRRKIRSEVRLKCKELLKTEGIYRFMGLIESIFGRLSRM